MEITINKQTISLGEIYNINVNGQLTFTASRGAFKLGIKLYNLNDQSPLVTIQPVLLTWLPQYNYIFNDDSNGIFEVIRTAFVFDAEAVIKKSNFEINEHRGRKFTIYKNGKQIAWWKTKMVTFFVGDNATMLADDDCDLNEVLTILLTVEHLKTRKERQWININFGRLFQSKKFDETWQPKINYNKTYSINPQSH